MSTRTRRRATRRKWPIPRSFRGQIVASTMLLMTALVATVGVVLFALLELTARHEIATALDDRTSDVVGAVNRASSDTLVVPDGALDPGELVYDDRGRLVAGTLERRAVSEATSLSTTTRPQQADVGDDLRLSATPITTPSGLRAVVVVSQETTPYERSERYALYAILALAVVTVGLTGLIARRVTAQALRPVRVMAETASEWSETDLGRRFGLGSPTNEITALGETLDHLLERVARAIRSEQRLTAELAHELRTPLTVIQGTAELALLRADAVGDTRTDLQQIVASCRVMGETITALLELAREGAESGADTCSASEVIERVRDLVPPTISFVVDAAPVRLAVPAALGARALAPLMDNAVRFARSSIRVEVCPDDDGSVAIAVLDDGPGIDADLAGRIFEPGTSGSGGTGLGLAIARRVARSLGGDVVVDGAHAVLRLPVA